MWLAAETHVTKEMEQKSEELARKILEVDSLLKSKEYLDLLASKGLAELARKMEDELKRRGIPYIVVRGLEASSEEDIEYVKSKAMVALEHKISREYIPVTLRAVEVLKVPHYEEWKDPPEDSTLDWLWLAVGVAGAIAFPLLYAALKR
jgi:superfamily I DNA/RNA helicase